VSAKSVGSHDYNARANPNYFNRLAQSRKTDAKFRLGGSDARWLRPATPVPVEIVT
jgi:hypothetical protein